MAPSLEPNALARKIPKRRFDVKVKVGPRRASVSATGRGFTLRDEPCVYVLVLELVKDKEAGWVLVPSTGEWFEAPSHLSWEVGGCSTRKMLSTVDAVHDAIDRIRRVPDPVEPVDV